LQQFRSFYKAHNPKNIQDAIEKFNIFGGVEWGSIDTSKPTFELIEELVLKDYRYIRNDVCEITEGMPLYHSILTAIALGDGKTHTAYKRAKVSKDVGDKAVDELCKKGIIKLKKAKKSSDKLYFNSPFLRFWFAFISPLFKGIKEGDFKEVQERFINRQSEFINLTFTQLSQEFLKLSLKKEGILECSSYWDEENEIDIYIKTKSKKIIIGSSKYTNSKIKKNELSKIQEKAKKLGIKADIFVIFSKKGFSNELKSLKGENLKLYSIKNLKSMVEL
jgi:hypothetical protein